GHSAGHGTGHGAGHGGHQAGTGHPGHGHAGHTGQQTRAETGSKPDNISPISIQTLLLFIAGIGVGGYFGDVFIAGTLIGVLAIAMGAGFAFSGAGYGLLNYLYKKQGSSETLSLMDAVGATGTVLVSIPEDGRGKVACRVAGRNETFSAESADNKAIPVNSAIKINGVIGSTVIVEPIEPEEEAKLLPWRSTDA
ncbi:MAG: NfeD family protein, partial [Blastocatellia bacterium]